MHATAWIIVIVCYIYFQLEMMVWCELVVISSCLYLYPSVCGGGGCFDVDGGLCIAIMTPLMVYVVVLFNSLDSGFVQLTHVT